MLLYELSAYFTEDGFAVDRAETKTNSYYSEDLYNSFKNDKYAALYNLGYTPKPGDMTAPVAFLRSIAEKFALAASRDSDMEITRKSKAPDEELLMDLLRGVPYAIGAEYVGIGWLKSIWEKLRGIFDAELAAYGGSAEEYFRGKNSGLNVAGRVFFHLVENKSEEYPFAFMATYSTGSGGNVSHMPLKNALTEYKGDQSKLLALLSTVSRAAGKSDFIAELVESGELFSPLKFDKDETYIFLKEITLYEECGIVCRIPDWWKKKSGAALSVSVGDKAPSVLGMAEIIAFSPEIYLGGMQMTREEIEGLLAQTSGLAFLKGKWVEVDHDKLSAVLAAFDKVSDMDDMTFADAMRMQLNINEQLGIDGGVIAGVTNGEWLESVKSKLLNPQEIEAVSPGEDFTAVLRHYQQTGFNWLNYMKTLGFGALLADDMGLGKTVQILALLEYLRANKAKTKTLLVIPASLLCNWQNEADRFAPKLRYSVIHAQKRDIDIDSADLFITTYGMAMRLDELRDINWDIIVLDESQAIKNASTKQSRAIKELKSGTKIAMTGTPVENRLSDLWSVFDFLNRGLLGSGKEFTDFTKSLKDNSSGYSRLRDIVSPFILRRLKTDKSVIADLPDKIEIKAYTTLTKKQVVLYNALVKELERALQEDEPDGIARKGLILSSIMKFKQICNHPDHYLGQPEFGSDYSGKFGKLAEICETIREKRERVLVFTQFKEMTAPLSNYLEEIFGRGGLVLHGGTQIKKRGGLVEQFNGEEYVPYMVLSLKAGGVGLNLTAANHVIHFDRWWNPAIENQATDRAFRIGQQKNVIVHKFVTEGTIEEKIDVMIEEKQKLANDIIVSSGENWITEMNNSELMKLFSLETGG